MKTKPFIFSYFLILFLLNMISARAQNQLSCISNKSVWTSIDCFKIGTLETKTIRKEMMQGDTILNGILYKKLYRDNSPTFNWATAIYVCAVREQNQQVFFVAPDNLGERMLYDFSKNNMGDSVEVFGLGLNYPNSIKLKIDQIFTTIVNGISRKTYQFNANGNYHTEELWYEGIGSSFGFLTPFHSISDNIFTLKCNAKNDTLNYLLNNIGNFLCSPTEPFNNCEYSQFPTKINSQKVLQINFYPNPIIDKLFLSDYKPDVNYIISNLQGQVIKSGLYSINGIEFKNIKAGIYLLQINQNELMGRVKIIKQ